MVSSLFSPGHTSFKLIAVHLSIWRSLSCPHSKLTVGFDLPKADYRIPKLIKTSAITQVFVLFILFDFIFQSAKLKLIIGYRNCSKPVPLHRFWCCVSCLFLYFNLPYRPVLIHRFTVTLSRSYHYRLFPVSFHRKLLVTYLLSVPVYCHRIFGRFRKIVLVFVNLKYIFGR